MIAAEEQQNPLPALSRSEGGQSRVCETCGDCVHREVLELLRARYPKIDELADAVTRVRALADALGIG